MGAGVSCAQINACCASITCIEPMRQPTTIPERWAALESNPEVLSSLASRLGVSEGWGVCEVLGLDADCLEIVPQPVAALILCHPRSFDAVVHPSTNKTVLNGVWHMRQLPGKLDSACGTIALVHALVNQREMVGLKAGSPLARFYEKTASWGACEICEAMDRNSELQGIHDSLVIVGPPGMGPTSTGQAQAQGQGPVEIVEIQIVHHFICFTEVKGHLVELDGLKDEPKIHGEVGSQGLLAAAAQHIHKEYFDGAATIDFSLLALAKAGT